MTKICYSQNKHKEYDENNILFLKQFRNKNWQKREVLKKMTDMMIVLIWRIEKCFEFV